MRGTSPRGLPRRQPRSTGVPPVKTRGQTPRARPTARRAGQPWHVKPNIPRHDKRCLRHLRQSTVDRRATPDMWQISACEQARGTSASDLTGQGCSHGTVLAPWAFVLPKPKPTTRKTYRGYQLQFIVFQEIERGFLEDAAANAARMRSSLARTRAPGQVATAQHYMGDTSAAARAGRPEVDKSGRSCL